MSETLRARGASVESVTKGDINDRRTELAEDLRAQEEYRNKLDAEKKKLDKLKEQFAEEVKLSTPAPADSTYTAKLERATATLENGFKAARAAAGELDKANKHAEAIVKLESLETILGVLATGESDPGKLSSDQRTAVAVARFIPSIADEADKLLKEARKPRRAPILLAKEHQRLLVEGYEAQLAIFTRRYQVRQQRLNATIAEAQMLFRARLVLEGGVAAANAAAIPGVDQTKSLNELQRSGTPLAKRRLYESLAYYFDEAYRYRVDQDVTRLRINAMTYESAMEASKTAALSWENLISHIGSILADYHAAGVKPADIAELVKGLGLFYIGERAAR